MQRPAPKIDIGHSGETAMQAIEKFRAHLALCESYNQVGKHPIDRLTVIHGYGSTGKGGSIQTRLRKFLTDNHIEFQVGEGRHGAGTTTILLTLSPLNTNSSPTEKTPALQNLDRIVEQAVADRAEEAASNEDEVTKLRRTIAESPRANRAENRLLQATKVPKTATELSALLAEFDEDLLRNLIKCLILEGRLLVQSGKLVQAGAIPKKSR